MIRPWILWLVLTLMTTAATAGVCSWYRLSPGELMMCSSSINYTYEASCENYVDFTLGTCEERVSGKFKNIFYKYHIVLHIYSPRENNLFLVPFNDYPDVYLDELTLQGNLSVIPRDIFGLVRLKKLQIGDMIEAVNFNDFLSNSLLNEINLSKNAIRLLDTDERSGASAVKNIDVSYNYIEEVPNGFLKYFNQMQYLNMSHNRISNIGLRAFDGMPQLVTLDVSHNRLLEIGRTFMKLLSLRELSISNNDLTKLEDYNFVTMIDLENLNFSSNNINAIGNDTFKPLTKLEDLDLGNNKIEAIPKQLLSNNTKLHTLSLRNNRIHTIEANSFQENNIKEFFIENNQLTGDIEGIFKGIIAHELDLSRGHITVIKSDSFPNMSDLHYLNLSLNAIQEISPLALFSLVSLNTLDLSHNNLKTLNFESLNLKKLSKFYAQNNVIEKIEKKLFENLVSLNELDLSFNHIKEIEPLSFANLKNLEVLMVTGNDFDAILIKDALQGLENLQRIEMSQTKVTIYPNESFSGLVSLKHINSSHGLLKEVEYNAFLGSGSLEILDLSFNQLDHFDVNTSTIRSIVEIYLNNNNIREITSETFSGLKSLQKLVLANNDIVELDSGAFLHLYRLSLDLSSNTRLNFTKTTFHDFIQLKELTVRNIKTEITFGNCTIKVLTLTACGINDVNKVGVFNIQGVTVVNLGANDIATIDQNSFQYMPLLVTLDLSDNQIAHIQPGSFLELKELSTLNLQNNRLVTLQFGVFKGPIAFRHLVLSRNRLRTFNVKILPRTEILSLDNNNITRLNIRDVFEANIRWLNIGGNQLPCEELVQLKMSNYSFHFESIVSAWPVTYFSENVDGISCVSLDSKADPPVLNNPESPLVSLLLNATDKLVKTEKSLEDYIESSNRNLEKLADINNDTNAQVKEIKQLVMTNDEKIDVVTENAMV